MLRWTREFDGVAKERAVVPENITLAEMPELNPVENIWQYMRGNWLSNRVYEDVFDHCCYAWNKLVDMPWKIMSIGTRDWASGS
jgi:hypothetical protein